MKRSTSIRPEPELEPANSVAPSSGALLCAAEDDEPRTNPNLRILPRRTAADAVVDLLVSLGIKTFFGVPGGPVIPVFDAILTNARATLIESRHETNGAFAAMGFQRATGQVPVVVATAGPGATNLVTGVVAAHLERVPMLIVCGDVPWASTGKRLLQDSGPQGIGIERMLEHVTRKTVRIAHANAAVGQVRAAVEAACDPENPGPALVVFAVDWAGSPVENRALVGGTELRTRRRAADVDPALVARIVQRLVNAERPLLLVGAGCREDQPDVLALAEALGAPFATTPRAKGLLSEEHPLSLRTAGMGASGWTRRYMKAGADVTLALGTDLDDVSTAGTPPIGEGGALIHVDTDASVFARNHPTELAVLCDVGALARALTQALAAHDTRRFRELASEAKTESAFDDAGFASDEAFPIAPHRAVADLQAAAGENATFVTDIGEHMLFALHYLRAERPDSFVIHLGLGSMASGIGSAIGLALGRPDRRVVCICGDGGMQMAGSELLVALKHRLPIVYAIFNDARYNMVYHGYRLTFERQAEWRTPTIDFVGWAQALGARAARIERAGEITPALLDQLTAGGMPAVLDIRQDPDIRIRGDGRIEAVRQMSMLHTRTDR